jgi:hypothetical protein
VDALRESLLKTLGSKVLDGLRYLGGTGGVRLALGAGVVCLRCCQFGIFETEILSYLRRWGERSRPPWERSAGCQKGLNSILEVLMYGDGEVKPTLGVTGGVRLSSSRHVDCDLVGLGRLIEECSS